MKRFSILTLLLICVIAALSMSHFLMSKRLQHAEQEVDALRRAYGHIRVEDPSKLYVASIAQHKGKLRVIAPPGGRYLLHLTETNADSTEPLTEKKPWISVALNGWKDGADEILTYSFEWDLNRNLPKLRVSSHTDHFFTYVPEDWEPGISMQAENDEIDATPQAEFAVDEDVVLFHARTPSLGRGVMLWLEPDVNYQTRNPSRYKKTEQ